jgi:(+)-pinoresinol hydroxylase
MSTKFIFNTLFAVSIAATLTSCSVTTAQKTTHSYADHLSSVQTREIPQEVTRRTDTAETVRGQIVYNKWCSSCHNAGLHRPGTNALHTKYDNTIPAVLLARQDLTSERIAWFVRNGVSIMPPFRHTEISNTELEELIGYMTAPF